MEKMPNFQQEPVKKFNDFNADGLVDHKEYLARKMDNIKEEFKIKNLDEVLKELEKLINDWHQKVNINEGDLREREMIIHEALLRLEPDYLWKEKNSELFAKYIQVGDDLSVIKFVQDEFGLHDVSPVGGLAAGQVLDEIEMGNMVNDFKHDKKEKGDSFIDDKDLIDKNLDNKN